ncbi:MAG TPA: Rieske (2Fe-2S) protein [Vicinamibacterales bacterium]|nr:Rieske (2Fe-2S) protein [Vicinamibacterales bacterium]
MSSHFENRRRALVRFVNGGIGLITAALAGLAGVAAAPRLGSAARRWRKAASIFDLPPNAPFAAVLAEHTSDGWLETSKQSVIYIDKQGDTYQALSATCSHLGCRVAWDETKTQYRCPCHGGVYDRTGRVVAGPPPAPLTRVNVRVNPQTSEIEVEL